MRMRVVASVVVLAGLLLSSGCGAGGAAPTPTPEPASPTEAPEPTTESTDEPEPTIEPTDEPAPTPEPTDEPEPTTLLFWSHWAEEENKKLVLMAAAEKFEESHPNVDVEFNWWQKAEMFPAMRNAFTAGEGYPDIFYFDRGALEFIEAGWLADLSDAIDWSDVKDSAKAGWTRPGPEGEEGTWAVALEMATDEIYYNKDIFEELGIDVPADYQYSADDFFDICEDIREAGYDPFANAVGDYAIMGHYIYSYVLLSQLGEQGLIDLWTGEKSWKDPEVVEALAYVNELFQIPVYPKTYSTMKLAESHVYFHTQQEAAMFLCGSWYTGRAFVPPDQGGQPADFSLGLLRYPAMPDGKGNDLKVSLVSGSIAVADMSPRKELALELLQTIASSDIGNMWLEETAVQTGIKTSEVGGEFQWYFDEYAETHEDQKYANAFYGLMMPPELTDAFHAVLCQGLPLGQISLDEAIEKMEEARQSIE